MNKKENELEEILNKDESKSLKEDDFFKEEKFRLLADIENQRKNHLKEIEQISKYANKKLLLKILPLIENYERALKLGENIKDKSIDKFISGFKMVIDDLKSSLKLEGIEEYSPIIKKDVWNSDFCEVLGEIENDDYEHGTVLEVLQKGYLLHKRVLVTSKVIVSKRTQSI
ncbi:MAG: Protein GrpE [Mycoplasmataceae bacterium]|nr:MAG: Protein GrpE [Mycoplasmataceae bacterium]